MNCVRWSIGDASLHGMGTSLVPCQCFGCHLCPWTKLLPMCPDRTTDALTSQCNGPGARVARPQAPDRGVRPTKVTMASSLDAVLHDSLRRFTADVFKSAWRGREREAISLYAFGYLTIECHRGAVLEHASQIGIEVAVPQLRGAKRKRQVCKD